MKKDTSSQDYLRQMVRYVKALDIGFGYKEIAQILGIHTNSFYNWLRGAYDFGQERRMELEGLLQDLLA